MIDNTSLLLQVIGLLTKIAESSGGGGGGAVTITNTPLPVIEQTPISGFNLETTQQDVLTELQSLVINTTSPLSVTETNPLTGFNLETTQQDVLTELQGLLTELQKSKDFEEEALIDTGNSNTVAIRRTEYEETNSTYVISYVDLAGAVYVPVGPLLTVPELEQQVITTLENLSTGLVCDNGQEVTNLTSLDSTPNPYTTGTILDNTGNLATLINITGTIGSSIIYTIETPKQSDIISASVLESVDDSEGDFRIYLSFGDAYDIGDSYIAFSIQGNTTTGNSILQLEVADGIGGYFTYPVLYSNAVVFEDKFSLYYKDSIVKLLINDNLIYSKYVPTPASFSLVSQYSAVLESAASTITPMLSTYIQESVCEVSICTTCDMNSNLEAINTQVTAIAISTNQIKTDLLDFSGSITVGGTSQIVLNAAYNRNYLLIQNISDTDMYINFGIDATTGAGSIKLVPNGSYELTTTAGGYMTTQSVSIICSVAGKQFTAKEA